MENMIPRLLAKNLLRGEQCLCTHNIRLPPNHLRGFKTCAPDQRSRSDLEKYPRVLAYSDQAHCSSKMGFNDNAVSSCVG